MTVLQLILCVFLFSVHVSCTLNPILQEFIPKNDYFVRVFKFSTCNDSQPTFMNYTNLRMTGGRNKVTVWGSVDIKTTLDAPLQYTLELAYRSLKTGVWHLADPIKIPDMCVLMLMNHHLMRYLNTMEPPITKCPIRGGLYTFNEMEVDMRTWGFMASNDNYYRWKSNLQSKTGKKACLVLEETIKVTGKMTTRRAA